MSTKLTVKKQLREQWLGHRPLSVHGELFLDSLKKALSEICKHSLGSEQISNQLSKKPIVGFYRSIRPEPELELDKILKFALDLDLIAAFPVVPPQKQNANKMHFLKVDEKTVWEKNPLGFMQIQSAENQMDDANPVIVPDLVLVPGLAFDKKGFRLGRGKGFYDQYFAEFLKIVGEDEGRSKASPVRIGICYQSQVVDELPNDSWDISMNYLVTELMVRDIDRKKEIWLR